MRNTIDNELKADIGHPLADTDHTNPRLVGAVVGGIVGAMYFLGAGRSLDYDGSVTVGLFVRHGSLLDVFRTPYAFNNHPYFSFLEHLMWDAGGHGEAWLRVIPIMCAAATVGVVSTWAARRWGTTAGVIAGAVLAANPMFADAGRSVRGYSLMVLGCTVATIVLIDSGHHPETMTKRRSALYVFALGIAIGSQFYAILVFAAHIATLVAGRRFDARWRRRSAAVGTIGALPYIVMLRPLYASIRNRSGDFQAGFPIDAARALLGHQLLAVAILATVVCSALSVVAVRRPLRPAFAAIATALLAVWIVLHPADLYPRFLVWMVPAVALGVAAAISRRPFLAPLTTIAIIAMALSQASAWTTDPIASRQAARIVDTARAEGLTPCAIGYNTEAILGYTQPVRSVFTVSQLAGCDTIFANTDTSAAQIHQLHCYFADDITLAGRTQIVVFTSPRATPHTSTCALT